MVLLGSLLSSIFIDIYCYYYLLPMIFMFSCLYVELKLKNHDKSNMGERHSFPPGKICWKKILRKDKYWHNQFGKGFSTGQNLLEKYWEKINIDTSNWEKLFDRSTEHK